MTGASVTTVASDRPAVSVGPAVTAPSGEALEELVRLTRRLRMPYLRKAALDVTRLPQFVVTRELELPG